MSRKRRYFQKAPVIFLLIISLCGCTAKEGPQPATETEKPQQEQPQEKPQQERPQEKQQQEQPQEKQQQEQPKEDRQQESPMAEEEKEAGFATPEEAVLSYLAGLRDNDFGRMEDSFLEKSRAVDIANQYAHLCEIDLIPELVSEGYVKLDGEGEAEKFLEQLNGKIQETDFENMEFLGFVPVAYFSDSYVTEEYQTYLKGIARDNGGSELENLAAAICINDTEYLLFFDAIKADDRWYVCQLGGALLNLTGAEPETLGFRLTAEDEEVLETLLEDNTVVPKLPEPKAAAAGRRQVESDGYDTPKEAAAAYLEGLKACDTEQMLGTFSVESYGQNYNMQAYLERMQAYMFLQQDVVVPGVNDFTKAMISCGREEEIKEDMLMQGNALYLWYCYYNDMEPGQTFSWEELQGKLELDTIEVAEFILPESIAEKSGSEQVNAMRAERAGVCGAEEQQDCVVVFTCEGEKYCLFMEEMKYNGRWYNSGFGNFAFSAIGGYADTMGTMPYEALEYIQEN